MWEKNHHLRINEHGKVTPGEFRSRMVNISGLRPERRWDTRKKIIDREDEWTVAVLVNLVVDRQVRLAYQGASCIEWIVYLSHLWFGNLCSVFYTEEIDHRYRHSKFDALNEIVTVNISISDNISRLIVIVLMLIWWWYSDKSLPLMCGVRNRFSVQVRCANSHEGPSTRSKFRFRKSFLPLRYLSA